MMITNHGMAGMGLSPDNGSDDTGYGWASDITGTIRDVTTAYNQQMILNANIERARNGLPPIDTRTIAPTYNVGLAPDIKNLMILGGIGLLLILMMKRGR
jgi:hypothetical protein